MEKHEKQPDAPHAPDIAAEKKPAKKPKKPKKPSFVPPLICLVIAFGLFVYFFLAAFPTTISSQKKINDLNASLMPTVRIAIDPTVAYRTGIVGQAPDASDDTPTSELLLYEMKDGYVVLLVKQSMLRALSTGRVKVYSGVKTPPISEDMQDAIADVIAKYDLITKEKALEQLETIPCVDLTTGAQSMSPIPAVITAVCAGLSFFWLLQRLPLRSAPTKRRSRSHR